MLSRIAESLYWIGRHVERVDGTARLADVVRLSGQEDPTLTEDDTVRMVLTVVMGLEVGEGALSFDDLARWLVTDPNYPSSIASSLRSARENARRAREILSSELWEAINTAYHRWQVVGAGVSAGSGSSVGHALLWARSRSALISGVMDSTMSHDEAWDFLVLGRALERADMTARMVAAGALPTGLTWSAVLTSCGALQAYVRTQGGLMSDRRAAMFLVLDRAFPRSVLCALNEAERALSRLSPRTERLGVSDEATRTLSRIRTSLEFRPVDAVLADLPHEMRRVQSSVQSGSRAAAARYFPAGKPLVWHEEIL